MDIFSIFTLLGGLALFLYGISTLSSALEKLAGGRLESILRKMTSSPIKSFILGLGITAAIQSSSAMTVMLVGLVNSGIMDLSQTVSVIIGSNVGTTVTAWILSLSGIQGSTFVLRLLKPETFSPILAMIGVVMIMSAKTNKRKSIGTVFVGFAILMFGMDTMAESMAPLAEMEGFRKILIAFANPILGMIVGLIVTMIIQSSSASIGILQALSISGGLSYGITVPIILGQNLGTCITAILSAIGVTTNAKRVAAVHVIYNILSVGICLPLFMIISHFFDVAILSKQASPFGIAVFHSVYNIFTAFAAFPFFKFLEKAAVWAIPTGKQDQNPKNVLLDERLLLAPGFAIAECYKQTLKMAETVQYNFINATKMLKSYHQKKADEIRENEIMIDTYEDKLNSFLIKLSGKELSEEDNSRISQLMLAIGDFERIGDHASYILQIAEKLKESERKLSEEAINELKVIINADIEIFGVTLDAYRTDNYQLAQGVEPLETVIKKLVRKVKNHHIQRLKDGNCTAEISFLFSDLLNDLRRIAAHCGNIATSVMQLENIIVDKHEYSHRNKDQDTEYIEKYENYKSKFSVPKTEV